LYYIFSRQIFFIYLFVGQLNEYFNQKENIEYSENALDEIVKLIKKNVIEEKSLFCFLNENEKNILRSKDLILFGDL
jgi:hypothetical protein